MNQIALERLPKLSNLLIRMMLLRFVFYPPMVSVVNDSIIAQIGEHISKPLPFDATKAEIKAEFRRLLRECKAKPM
jgi:hypothetical protein